MKKFLLASAAAVAASVALASPVLAQETGTGTDFSVITAAADYSSVVSALMTIGAAIAVLFIAWAGIRMVLRALKTT